MAYVKGWRRSLAFIPRCLGLDLDELTDDFQGLDRGRFAFLRRLLRCPSQVLCFMSLSPSGLPASLHLIHASVNNFETTKDVIFASRGFISVVNSHVFLAMKSFSHNSHSVYSPSLTVCAVRLRSNHGPLRATCSQCHELSQATRDSEEKW